MESAFASARLGLLSIDCWVLVHEHFERVEHYFSVEAPHVCLIMYLRWRASLVKRSKRKLAIVYIQA